MIIANATNGLLFKPYDAVSIFLSTHGHNCKMGYFEDYAMPWMAVIELLKGNTITMIDATQHDKQLPDSFKFGVTTWAIVFNRALREYVQVAPWETREMRKAAFHKHKKLVNRIRRLESVYGNYGPTIIGNNIQLVVHRNFEFDDKPELIGKVVTG